jgi:hypothetical protein
MTRGVKAECIASLPTTEVLSKFLAGSKHATPQDEPEGRRG